MQSHSLSSFPKPFASSSSFTFLRSNTLQSSSFATSLLSHCNRNLPPRIQIGNLFQGTTEFVRAYKHYRAESYQLQNSDEESVAGNSDCECDLVTPIVSSDDNGSIGLVKFMLLFAFFTLRDSYPASAAASDFATTGLNSIPVFGDVGDLSTGFASAFLLIFFSELGDKTFFIAALLAARNSAGVVFVGTFGALAAMTVISVALGRTFHYVDELLPFRFGQTDLPIDDIAAVCLLVYFGVSTLLDASSSDGQKSDDEQKEVLFGICIIMCHIYKYIFKPSFLVPSLSNGSRCFLCNGSYLNQAELAVSEFSGNGAGIVAAASTIVSTFLLVFVAEWGDKSFFSTIALAAASSPLGVIAGSLAGHGVATLLAVLGGSLLGTFLSEKVIAYIGGVLFLVFAAVTVFEIVQ